MREKIKFFAFKYLSIIFLYKIVYFKKYFFDRKKINLDDEKKNMRKYFIIGIPNYGNLGDQAISISQYEYIKNISDDDSLVYNIYLSEFVNYWYFLKNNISENDVIVFQGGGNIGDEYLHAEFVRQICIKEFIDNKIVIFPQTCFFSDTPKGNLILSKSKKIYASHKNLVLVSRERKSYDSMRQFFPKNRHLLTPDIVLLYPCNTESVDKLKNKIIFCIRNDQEKNVSDKEMKRLMEIVKSKGYKIEITDTCIDGDNFYNLEKSKKLVDDKISELSEAQLVVTDRLHGMVLTALSSTNCIALGNYNHKVEGVYQWLDHYSGIQYINETTNFERIFEQCVNSEYKYNRETYLTDFENLREILLT